MSRVLAVAFANTFSIAPRVARAQQPIAAQPIAAPAPVDNHRRPASEDPGVAAPAPIAPAPVAAPAPIAPAPVAAPVVNPADGECTTTTTTTTHCTGAAAPYAAHPAPPMVIVPAPAPSLTLVPCPVVIPNGWNLQQDPNGTWWRTRRHHGVGAVWGPGLGLWMLSYFAGTIGGVAGGAPETAFPIVGSFLAAGLSSDSPQAVALFAIDGVAQLGGLIMFIVGASMDGKLERLPVTVAPTSLYGGGGGVALTGHF